MSSSSSNAPGFEIVRELGRGGMASVYLAMQTSLQREVALKIMSPALSVDSDFKQRFLKEGQLIAQLNHPHIVTVYDIGFASKRYYIAMEYLGGGSLKEQIRKGMEVGQAIRTTKQVAQALGYAHKRNIIHRDVKPLNIMFREPGEAVLTDYGIAKVTAGDTQLTRTGMLVGTPSYMSPEQARGEKLDGRSDLYSLGIVLYEMLTGERPYDTEDSFSTALKHLTAPIPQLPAKLDFMQPVIQRLLAKDANDRYSDDTELVAHLEQIEQEITLGTQMYVRPSAEESSANTVVSEAGSAPKLASGAEVHQVTKGGATTVSLTFNRKPVVLIGLLLTVLAGAGGGYYFLMREPALDEKTERIVQLLLDKADAQLQGQRYVKPSGDNASQTFREILRVAPNYKPALKGLGRVADQLEQRARAQHDKGEIESCLQTIEQGLDIDPKHAGLLNLQTLVEKEQALEQLFTMAEQQMASGYYSAPKGNNAVESYRRALALSPGHPQAEAGMKRIMDWFVRQAGEHLENGEYQGAQALVTEGLKIQPGQADLQRIGRQTTAQIEAQQTQERIADLLSEAESRQSAGKLLAPAGDNALESYREILRIAPDNQIARQGEADIRADLLKRVLDAIQNDDLDNASSLLTTGKQSFPDDVKLIAADEVLQQRLAAAQTQQNIAELLKTAESRVAEGNRTEPEGASALDAYQAVLALDADNAEARAGKKRLAGHFADQAQRAHGKGELADAFGAIEQGLKAAPDDQRLAELKQVVQADLQKQRENEQLRARIAELLQTAAAQLENGRLSTPAGDNALQSYRNVLQIDPEQTEARQGVERVSDRYKEQIRQADAQGRLTDAVAQTNEALSAFPADADLQGLKTALAAKVEEEIERRRQEQQLADAEALLARENLSAADVQAIQDGFSQVLTADPDNTRAKQGIQQLAERFFQKAEQARAVGRFTDGMGLIDQGLALNPAHQGLKQLRAMLQQDIASEKKHQRIARMLADADDHLAANRLIQPRGRNALEAYQDVLTAEPDNRRAADGLTRVADAYASSVQAMLNDGRLRQARKAVKDGLKRLPNNAALSALKQQIAAEQAAVLDRDKVARLLRNASRQMRAKKLLLPRGDNARETYRQVLELDAENREAKQGIASIGTRYLELGKARLNKGQWAQATTMVDRGLSVAPENQDLLALKAEIQAAAKNQEQQRKLADQQRKLEREKERALAEQRRKEAAEKKRLLAEQRKKEMAGKLESHLQEGDRQYEVGNLNQARKAYQKALKIDADNSRAQAGLRKVAKSYYGKALKKKRAGDIKTATRYVNRGLLAQPRHNGLLTLRKEIQAEKRAQAREEQRRKEREEQRRLAAQREKERQAEWARRQAEQQYEQSEPAPEPEPEKKAPKLRIYGTF